MCDGGIAADRGESALILVAERYKRPVSQLPHDVLRDCLAHLDRHRRDHRQRVAVLFEIGRIPDDEDLRMSGDLERPLDGNASLARGFQAQRGT